MIDVELIQEIDRIKRDPMQMQMVMLCMMMHPAFVDSLMRVYYEASNGKPDTAVSFAAEVEAHIVEHAKQIIQLRRARTLLGTPAASPSAH